MKDKEIETKNEIFFLKIKKYEKKMPFHRREINSSILKDYDKISKEINEEIINIDGEKAIKNRFPIIVISHPKIKDIFIYSKEQWDFYYNYNITEKCKSNKSLKIEYCLINRTKTKGEKIDQKIKICKKATIKYILENIPCDIILNFLMKFFEERMDLIEEFKEYMITDLINNNIYKKDENNNEDIDENININKIMSYNEKNEIKINKIDYKKLEKIYKGYYIENNEFINILNNKFDKFSKHQKSFNEIKNILKDNEEKNKKDKEQNKKDIEQNTIFQSLDLQNSRSLENLINDNSSININEHLLQSVLNPPSNYIPKLMENGNFFKKLNNDEYFSGLAGYKDQLNQLNMKTILMINKDI